MNPWRLAFGLAVVVVLVVSALVLQLGWWW